MEDDSIRDGFLDELKTLLLDNEIIGVDVILALCRNEGLSCLVRTVVTGDGLFVVTVCLARFEDSSALILFGGVFIASLCPAGNLVTPEGVALVMLPKTAITLLLGRRAEKVSSSSAVRRRAAGDVGSILASKLGWLGSAEL